jgi:plasmid maintenance system antidote protein VapI
MSHMRVANKIKELMQEHGIESARELAVLMPVSHATISNALNGSPVKIDMAVYLSRVFAETDVADWAILMADDAIDRQNNTERG